MAAVPVACDVVPIATPRAMGSEMRSAVRTRGPTMAPTIPVDTTRTAVIDMLVPRMRAISIATGVDTDLGATASTSMRSSEAQRANSTTVAIVATEPQTIPSAMDAQYVTSRRRWR